MADLGLRYYDHGMLHDYAQMRENKEAAQEHKISALLVNAIPPYCTMLQNVRYGKFKQHGTSPDMILLEPGEDIDYVLGYGSCYIGKLIFHTTKNRPITIGSTPSSDFSFEYYIPKYIIRHIRLGFVDDKLVYIGFLFAPVSAALITWEDSLYMDTKQRLWVCKQMEFNEVISLYDLIQKQHFALYLGRRLPKNSAVLIGSRLFMVSKGDLGGQHPRLRELLITLPYVLAQHEIPLQCNHNETQCVCIMDRYIYMLGGVDSVSSHPLTICEKYALNTKRRYDLPALLCCVAKELCQVYSETYVYVINVARNHFQRLNILNEEAGWEIITLSKPRLLSGHIRMAQTSNCELMVFSTKNAIRYCLRLFSSCCYKLNIRQTTKFPSFPLYPRFCFVATRLTTFFHGY